MWKIHYHSLLNSNSCDDFDNDVSKIISDHLNNCNTLKLNENLTCTSQKVQCLAQKLKSSCSHGVDVISKNHFLYAHTSVFMHLSNFFNLCLNHNHIPVKCLEYVINLIVKNSKCDPKNINNCRPMHLCSCHNNF